jgi:hypothetical protein
MQYMVYNCVYYCMLYVYIHVTYLRVLDKRVRALGLGELPNLHRAVTRGCGEVRPVGVEVQAMYQIYRRR